MKYGTFNLAKRGGADVYHRAKIREPLITLEMANNREFIRKLRSFLLVHGTRFMQKLIPRHPIYIHDYQVKYNYQRYILSYNYK